jgi:predicted dehydrogenase
LTDKKYKIEKPKGAIIGFGNIALLGHLPAFKELGVDITAVVDVCEKRREIATKAGLKAFESLDGLEDIDLDFIDICTPPSFREEPIRFAVENGLDVICEKPISTPSSFLKIKELVLEGDIFFYPIHNWKNAPHYVKVKEIVEENGGVENLQMNTLRTHFSTGNSDWNPAWRVNKSISGGGIIMDHGYHNIYLAMHLFGTDFDNVVLEGISYFDSNPEIENRACFSLEFPKARKATITLDWGAKRREIKNTIYECNSTLKLGDRQIVNSDRTFEFEESLSGDSVHGTWFYDVFNDFLTLRESKEKTHFLEAIKVLEGIDSLYKQAKNWH